MSSVAFALLFFFFSGAAQQTSPAQKITPQVRIHFEAAEGARAKGEYSKAELEYRKVIALSPHFAEAYMNLGLVYQLQKKVPAAMRMFEQALKYRPDLAGANFFLGMDYCQRGQCRRALPFLRSAVRSRPNQAEIWLRLATAEEAAGDLPAEINTLHHGLKLHPHDVNMLYLLGHAYESLGRQAIDRLKALHANSSYVDQLLAEDYVNSGYLSAALVHLQNAVSASPSRPDLHLEIAEIYLRAGRLKLANDAIQKTLELDPHNLRALVRRGEVRLFENDVDGAMADWSRAITIDAQRTRVILGIRPEAFAGAGPEPLSPSLESKVPELQSEIGKRRGESARLAVSFLKLYSGDAGAATDRSSSLSPGARHVNVPASCDTRRVEEWLDADNLEAAVHCADKLTAAVPARVRLQLARANFLTGHPSEALELLNALPANARDAPAALYWRVRACRILAFEDYQRLYDIAPNSYRVHELKGDTYRARGQDTQAIQEYREALREKPDLPNLHYEVGHLLWKNFKLKAARQDFQAELAINPRHAGALVDLGTTYLYEHQPRKALPYLLKARRIDPDDPDVDHFLGMAYMRVGDFSRAQTELEKVAKQDKTGKIHYLLARIYEALGKRKEAAHEFAVSSDLNHKSHLENDARVQRLAKAEELLK